MGLLDDAIKQHLELKRLRGADPNEIARQEHEALDPPGTQPIGGLDVTPVYEEPTAAHPPPEPLPVPGEAAAEPAPAAPPAASAPAVTEPAPAPAPAPAEPAPATAAYEPPPERPAVPRTHSDTGDMPAVPHHEVQPEASSPSGDEFDMEVAPPVDAASIVHQPTAEYALEDLEALRATQAQEPDDDVLSAAEADEDVDADELEETPEFLQETPEHDRLWFEQKPPRDFDF